LHLERCFTFAESEDLFIKLADVALSSLAMGPESCSAYHWVLEIRCYTSEPEEPVHVVGLGTFSGGLSCQRLDPVSTAYGALERWGRSRLTRGLFLLRRIQGSSDDSLGPRREGFPFIASSRRTQRTFPITIQVGSRSIRH